MELTEKEITKIHTNLHKGYLRIERLTAPIKKHLDDCTRLHKSRAVFYNNKFVMRVNKPMSILPIKKVESVMIVYVFDYVYGVGFMLEIPIHIYDKIIGKFIFVKNKRKLTERYIINHWRDLNEYVDYLSCYKPLSLQIKENEAKLENLQYELKHTTNQIEDIKRNLQKIKLKQ